MTSPLAEIHAVDREQALGLRLLSPADRDQLRDRVRATYGGGERWMWDGGLSDSASVQSPEGWQWISGFVGSRPCVLLFDVSEEVEMLHVPSGAALETLLAESYGFEFYVTDADASYLICFNHHDMLIGAGSARAWVEGLNLDP